ncbi:MAG: hypothetical protein F4Z04_07985 [Acidobacteria bacterium]|nr:hypothetical protein [Acidobacteriota bacterium]
MTAILQTRRDHWIVLAAALLARAVVPIIAIVSHGVDYLLLTDDSHEYLRLAESLTAGSFSRDGEPELLRTPGYPLLVALGVLAGAPIGLTIAIQTALGGVAAVVVYALARQAGGSLGCRDTRPVALAAGLIYALDPLSVVHSGFVLSETLFTTLMVAHLFVLSKYFETGQTRYVAPSAVLAAASAFVRPVALYWPLVVVAILLSIPASQQTRRLPARLAPAVVFLALTLTPVLVWTARNASETGYSRFSAAGDYGLYVSLGGAIEGLHRNETRQRVELLAERNGWTTAERYDYMRREGVRTILNRPAHYIAVHGRAILQSLTPAFSMYVEIYLPDYGSANTWTRLFGSAAIHPRDYLPALPMYLLVGLACATQYLLALFGVRHAFVARSGTTVLVLVSAAYFLFMAGAVGDIATARMRHPAMPAICVLAGLGASAVIDRYWQRR